MINHIIKIIGKKLKDEFFNKLAITIMSNNCNYNYCDNNVNMSIAKRYYS